MRYLSFIVLLICTIACKKKADTTPLPPVELNSAVLAENLSQPWEILWGPDNFIWVTERGGKISRVNPANGQVSLVHTLSDVDARGEGGLLGMVLHPDFTNNPYVYLSYNYSSAGNYLEKVVRFTYAGGKLASPLPIISLCQHGRCSQYSFAPRQ
jgi:aldose sugar dehydrogenase